MAGYPASEVHRLYETRRIHARRRAVSYPLSVMAVAAAALVLVGLLYAWSVSAASRASSSPGVAPGMAAGAEWAGGQLVVDVEVANGGRVGVSVELVNVSCTAATGGHVALTPVYDPGPVFVGPGGGGGLSAVYAAGVEPASCAVTVRYCWASGGCGSWSSTVPVAAGG